MPRPEWTKWAGVLLILAAILPATIRAGIGASAHSHHCTSTISAKAKSATGTQTFPAIDLYRRSLIAGKSVSYKGRQFITVFGEDGRTSAYVTDVDHRAPDEYRIVYLAPHNDVGQIIIQNDTDQWTYRPDTHELIHAHVPAISMTSDAKMRVLTSHYKITRAAEPRIVAGRKTFEVIVQLKGSSSATVRYWIDPYTGLALRTERNHPDGSVEMDSYFSDIKLNPAFSASTFDPSAMHPPGVRLVDKTTASAESGALTTDQIAHAIGGLGVAPHALDGYQLQGANIMLNKGRETLHLHYTDGLATLSLFESVRRTKLPTVVRRSHPVMLSRTVTAHARHDVHYNTLNWDKGRLNMTLVGDLSEQALVRIAQGI